jgi:Cu/Ag efflux protein CusF
MSNKLIRYALVVCVAAVALTASQSVLAMDEKTQATPAPKSDTLSGKIEAFDVKASTITIKHKKETKTFTVAPDCKFTGAGDKEITLAGLVIGDQVKVTYTQEGEKLVAHHIGHIDLKKKAEEAPQQK